VKGVVFRDVHFYPDGTVLATDEVWRGSDMNHHLVTLSPLYQLQRS